MKQLLSIHFCIRFCLLFLVIASCSKPQKPVFKRVGNVSITEMQVDKITLTADAIFYNPNALNGKLSIDNFKVYVDTTAVGTVRSDIFSVPAQKEFSIPLQGTFSLSKLYKNDGNSLLGSLMKIVQTDSLSLRYKGIIRYHKGSFTFPYKVDQSQKIKIK